MTDTALMQRRALDKSLLFSRLYQNEADALLADATIAHYARGERIFANGDPGNAMMAVLKGRVVISLTAADGSPVVLSTLRAGEVFGEIALLDGGTRTADATAMSACALLVVDRRPLLSLLRNRPDLCVELMLLLCGRLRSTDGQVEDLACRNNKILAVSLQRQKPARRSLVAPAAAP